MEIIISLKREILVINASVCIVFGEVDGFQFAKNDAESGWVRGKKVSSERYDAEADVERGR